MEQVTTSAEYSDYLSNKYLPFRDQYLFYFYYPKLLKQFERETEIIDFGCGLGSFLRFCKKKKRPAKGYDTNGDMVLQCKKENLKAEVASILDFPDVNITSCFCDNVLEHLSPTEIDAFFTTLQLKMCAGGRFVIVVPGKAGYKKDYTHKTFVDVDMIKTICRDKDIKLVQSFYHPFNVKWVSDFLYLNMTVFVLEF